MQSQRAKLAAGKARVEEAQATLAEKKLDYERKRRLVKRGVVSEHDFEVAQAAYERAIAEVESAKADVAAAAADLQLSETNLAKACICSPIKGTVLDRNVEPGQTVATSFQAPTLFTIAEDLTQMEVRVDVDEADVGEVAEGQRATFSVDAYPNRTFTAHIKELRYGSETVQGVVTYKAVLQTQNPDLLLRPGMTATAEITVQQLDDVITIPNEALRYVPEPDKTGDDRSFIRRLLPGPPRLREPTRQATTGPERQIWVLTEDEPKQVEVTIGPSDGRRTQVVEGDIEPGQRVIVDTAATTS
ncbi:efflux RND transporter periplasmic adaptor subunit [Dichotomicrobium thermohalophilum]|uniref:efflux RND transporter periplasmic adaptor subunit n=1 Tax=Dichotomicrobium thermohalophilum TaxID=933063 RepID=UPI0014757A04|nr:efflux RND transporter periplasmic adaptor subunit [Dichotomicrobium thermohalophilum]